MLQPIRLYHVTQLKQRYVIYADSFVDYVAVEEYYMTRTESEFRALHLQIEDSNCSVSIKEEQFAFDDEQKKYFQLHTKPITLSNVTADPAFVDFQFKKQLESKKMEEESRQRVLALSKLTPEDRALLKL